MDTDIDILRVLGSIDQSLKTLVAFAQRRDAKAKATPDKAVADDADLGGKFGDPEVRFNPRDWSGPPCKGRRLSECPPEFLDVIAETFDYFAAQAEAKGELTDKGKPVAEFKRRDAARARGWAKRLRAGYRPTNGAAAPTGWADDQDFA